MSWQNGLVRSVALLVVLAALVLAEDEAPPQGQQVMSGCQLRPMNVSSARIIGATNRQNTNGRRVFRKKNSQQLQQASVFFFGGDAANTPEVAVSTNETNTLRFGNGTDDYDYYDEVCVEDGEVVTSYIIVAVVVCVVLMVLVIACSLRTVVMRRRRKQRFGRDSQGDDLGEVRKPMTNE